MTSTREILAALTTTFTPPPQCSVFGGYGGGTTGVWFQAQSCSGGGPHDAASCWPPATLSTPSPDLDGFGFYSPGIYCPAGYNTACSAAMLPNGLPSSMTKSSFSFQFPLQAGETGIGCCPPDMSCQNPRGIQICERVIGHGTLFPVGACGTDGPSYSSIGSAVIGVPTGSSSTANFAVVFAPLIQIVYKSSDSPALLTSTSSDSSAPSSSIPSITKQTLSSSPTAVSQDTGLSAGAKIGIGVGVPLAVLLVAGLGAMIFFFRRRKTRYGQPADFAEFPATPIHKDGHHFGTSVPSYQAPAEVHADSQRMDKNKAFKNGGYELDNIPWQQRTELPGAG